MSKEMSQGSQLISQRVNGIFKLVLDSYANTKNFQIIYFFIKKKVIFHFSLSQRKSKTRISPGSKVYAADCASDTAKG